MENDLKKELLGRMFSSVEYMRKMADSHESVVKSLENGLREFYIHSTQRHDWHVMPKSDWPDTWERTVLSNLKRTQKSVEDGIENYKSGNLSTIRSAAGSVHNVFRNLDNFGWGWWDYLPSSYKKEFNDNLVDASKMASNVVRELAKAWKSEDSILKESITGKINEGDLRRYLMPGESI